MTITTERAKLSNSLGRLLDEWQTHHKAVYASDDADVCDAHSMAMCGIEERIWAMPANNAADIYMKLSLVTATDVRPPVECMTAVLHDLRKLSGFNVSPTFEANIWLHRWEARGGGYVVRGEEVLLCSPIGKDMSELEGELDLHHAREIICQHIKGIAAEGLMQDISAELAQ